MRAPGGRLPWWGRVEPGDWGVCVAVWHLSPGKCQPGSCSFWTIFLSTFFSQQGCLKNFCRSSSDHLVFSPPDKKLFENKDWVFSHFIPAFWPFPFPPTPLTFPIAFKPVSVTDLILKKYLSSWVELIKLWRNSIFLFASDFKKHWQYHREFIQVAGSDIRFIAAAGLRHVSRGAAARNWCRDTAWEQGFWTWLDLGLQPTPCVTWDQRLHFSGLFHCPQIGSPNHTCFMGFFWGLTESAQVEPCIWHSANSCYSNTVAGLHWGFVLNSVSLGSIFFLISNIPGNVLSH